VTASWRTLASLTLLGAGALWALGACKVKIPSSQGEATGLECETSETCPYPESPCLLAMCLDGECVHVPAPQGNLPEDEQERGDCKQRYCDGHGNISSFPARIDLPADDGNPCTEAMCDVDLPKQSPKPAGARCGDEGLCNGAGVCGVCLPGKERCEGNAVTRCGDEGQWSRPEACPTKQPLCAEAKCIGVVAIASGRSHACARFDDGTVRCWGANHRGQLGDSGVSQAQTPAWAAVPGGIAHGPRHACGIRSGTALCWGANDYGQLGNGTYVSSQSPVPVSLPGVAEVAVGLNHSCAQAGGGEVYCWGRNDRGQLGSGKRPPTAAPEEAREAAGAPRRELRVIPGLTGAKALHVGGDHSCVLGAAGPPRCWGLRPYGLPAPIEKPEPAEDGSPPDPEAVKRFETLEKLTLPSPTVVAGLKDVRQVACGLNHCCVRLAAGTVSCWGAGTLGQLGRSPRQDSFRPVAVAGLAGVERIALGTDFGCALLSGGKVSCWGANQQGQLGTGSEAKTGKATIIEGLPVVSSLHLGASFACALTVDGGVHCWGSGREGQLGPGSAELQRSPKPIPW